MSFISNKVLNSVSTMQNVSAKQQPKKSILSSTFLNSKTSQKSHIKSESKQFINWHVNEQHQIPLMNYFIGNNSKVVAEIESSLTELEIIMDRIQNKAMNEQASIQVVFKELKELQRILTQQIKDIFIKTQQEDKQQMKNILTKIKSLFVTVSQKLTQNFQFRQPVQYFRQEYLLSQQRIDQTFPLLFQNENKQREKQWELQIDALSHTMFQLESHIRQMKSESVEKHKIFEGQIKALHADMVDMIVVIYFLKKEEKQITDYEHDVIMQLIGSAAEKVAFM